jgi:hypothetical protein
VHHQIFETQWLYLNVHHICTLINLILGTTSQSHLTQICSSFSAGCHSGKVHPGKGAAETRVPPPSPKD